MVDYRHRKQRNQGVALLSVLIVLTLAVLLVAGLNERLGKQIRFSSALQNQEQLYWYSISAEELARQILQQDFKDNRETVHLGQVWALRNRSFPMDKGNITLHIEDRQNCFNLNSLAQENNRNTSPPSRPHSVQVFHALLLNLGIDPIQARQITAASRDWVYPGRRRQSVDGASDNDYLSLPVPYLPGDTFMRDESEWRAVLGVTAPIARRVLPYLCTLPEGSLQFNVNTLPASQPALLAAMLLNQITVSQAEALLSSRPREGWKDFNDFAEQLPEAQPLGQEIQKTLGVSSRYFEVNARIQVQRNSEWFQSLFTRQTDHHLITIRRRVGE